MFLDDLLWEDPSSEVGGAARMLGEPLRAGTQSGEPGPAARLEGASTLRSEIHGGGREMSARFRCSQGACPLVAEGCIPRTSPTRGACSRQVNAGIRG